MEPKKRYLDRAVERLKNDDDILPENKDLILDFHRYLQVNDYSANRRYKYLLTLPKLARRFDKPFPEATKDDIEKVVMWVKRRRDINRNTKVHYKILLKRFYKWIGDGHYPDCVRDLSTTERQKRKLPDDMLEPSDIKKLLKAADNARDRAFISMLWETGARIEEILALKVGDLHDHKHGMKVVVDGKTGPRRLILVDSVSFINTWLESHPSRDKDDALWTNIGTKNHGAPAAYQSMYKALKKTAKAASVEKDINPHNFRHSRATYMANHFTEAQMCEWFGWVPGSKVPGRYVHLSGRDIDNAYISMYGLDNGEEEEEPSVVERVPCPRCGYENNDAANFCAKCGMALNLDAAKEMDALDEKFATILDDEEVKAMLLEKLQELES